MPLSVQANQKHLMDIQALVDVWHASLEKQISQLLAVVLW